MSQKELDKLSEVGRIILRLRDRPGDMVLRDALCEKLEGILRARLARYWCQRIRVSARSSFSQEEIILDAISQALMVIIRKAEAGDIEPDEEEREMGYIVTIAKNHVLATVKEFARAKRRECPLSKSHLATHVAAIARAERGALTSASLVDQDKLLGRVREGIRKLPETQQTDVVLRFFKGMSHRDIARALGTRINTSRTRLHRAIARLRKILGEHTGIKP